MTGLARTRASILIYGLLSATLYCALLPLWEGFDEFYHYGYVQYLSTTLTLPVVGEAKISSELWTSLDFTPVSHFLQPYFQRPTTSFHDYFALSAEQRERLRTRLEEIDRHLQAQPSPRDNYEAKQAPLTYLLLAPFDRLLTAAPLPARVLALRLLLAIVSVALLWIGTRRLAQRLGLAGGMEAAALFVVFTCQMIYGTTCHIANDALMLPWLVFFLDAVIGYCESPACKRAALTGFLIAAGLLIKASLLVLVPLVFAAPALLLFRPRPRFQQAAALTAVSTVVLLAGAGPWYIRNVTLYHNLTATNDTTTGIGLRELLRAAAHLPWRESFVGTVHSALWTGNSSFTTFSASTLNIVVVFLALAAVSYACTARRTTPELITLAAIALYSTGLVLIALSFFLVTHGETTAAMPWYIPVLFAPLLALCFLGLARWPRGGRWLAIPTVLLCAYLAAATWLAKLLPMYGGFEDPRAHLRQLLAWYLESSTPRNSILATICPAPLGLLYALLAAVLAVLITSTVATCFSLSRSTDEDVRS